MCYRYTNKQSEKEFRAKMRLKAKSEAATDELPFEFYHTNGFAHEPLPLVTQGVPDDIQYFNWGLIPHWVRNKQQASEIQKMTLNATCENVFEKPSFKESIFKRRCLIPATGFFEWRTEGKNKYPYLVMVKDDDFPDSDRSFCFGGIYDRWTDKATGQTVKSFSIITVPANEKMQYIHNSKGRMPLILHHEDHESWLIPELDEGHINALMQPYPNELIKAYTIGKRITDRNLDPNNQDTLLPVEYDEVNSWI